ncbi:MAG: hypothetical protein QM820_57130 [Minicystis sp.]
MKIFPAVLLVGCGSTSFSKEIASSTLMLTQTYAEGSTPGLCVLYDPNSGQPTLQQCPTAIAAVIEKDTARSLPSTTPKEHKWMVLRIEGGGRVPGFSGEGGLEIAHETVIYGTHVSRWKTTEVSEADFQVLANQCANQATGSGFQAVVTQEWAGCSLQHVEVRARGTAPTWNFSSLAQQGRSLGKPVAFRSQLIKLDAAADSKCEERVAIQVQVMGFGDFCRGVVAPEQIRRLTESAKNASQRVDDITKKLDIAAKDKDDLRKRLNNAERAKSNAIEELKDRLAKSEAESARLRAELQQVSATLTSVLGKIDTTQKQFQPASNHQ